MKKLNLVSLFTGAGGLDYGFESAGFSTRIGVELDSDCCKTIEANRSWPIINDDIHNVTSKEILDTANLRAGEVDILIGGPPCQPFSKAGYWVHGDTKRLDDPRADTLYAYMRCVRDLLPKVFFLENVHGINFSGKEEGFVLLQRLTKDINKQHGTNYQLYWKVINTADYGVPQLRKRFFLVAHRDGTPFKFPLPTHREASEYDNYISTALFPCVTAWDAIGDLEVSPNEDLKVRGRWAELLPSIPEGENYLWHTDRKGGLPLFGWRTRYWSFLLKLAKNLPSWTIQAQPGPAIGPFHWKNRLLSVKELSSLQTFPKDISFVGNRTSVQKQIGNAVPSLIAEILARSIGNQFFDLDYSEALINKVSIKRPIPSPEPVEPVQTKFLGLVGNHPAHPGEGKGKSYEQAIEDKEKQQLALNFG